MPSSGRARVLVITGPGKGKTTAATGIILRSLAAGKKVLLTRFTKTRHSGELDILGTLPGLTIVQGDYGMTPPRTHADYPKHVQAAQDLFRRTQEMVDEFEVVVMDEICGVTARDMVSEEAVAAFVKGLDGNKTAILTGRGAGTKLLAVADTVSEILSLKHGYLRGIAAQKGVEL
ncbi:MAG: cob(I)yrinic acid a,c-diamide adenosyltransferase [Planctomycetaceae bacterium]|nr:cob(I)yrinic acid a,c-diamide adenosyltransferase [Planctomycetaceae bacterium]